VVPRTPAEIPFKPVPYLFLGQAFGMRFYKINGAHDHSGRTVSALQGVMFPEHLLHRVQRPVSIHQAFYGQDRSARSLNRQYCARFHRHSADLNDARPALAGIATDMRSSKPKLITQKLYEKCSGLNIGLVRLAVHCKAYLGQLNLLLLAIATLWYPPPYLNRAMRPRQAPLAGLPPTGAFNRNDFHILSKVNIFKSGPVNWRQALSGEYGLEMTNKIGDKIYFIRQNDEFDAGEILRTKVATFAISP
jgi:hypothetical protein